MSYSANKGKDLVFFSRLPITVHFEPSAPPNHCVSESLAKMCSSVGHLCRKVEEEVNQPGTQPLTLFRLQQVFKAAWIRSWPVTADVLCIHITIRQSHREFLLQAGSRFCFPSSVCPFQWQTLSQEYWTVQSVWQQWQLTWEEGHSTVLAGHAVDFSVKLCFSRKEEC